MSEDFSNIRDDETLYRRIPVSQNWCDGENVDWHAFRPTKKDETGLSLARTELKSREEAARGPSRDGYYLAEVRVQTLKDLGFSVSYRPDVIDPVTKQKIYDPSHVEIPELRADVRRHTDITDKLEQLVSNGILNVYGPYRSQDPQ